MFRRIYIYYKVIHEVKINNALLEKSSILRYGGVNEYWVDLVCIFNPLDKEFKRRIRPEKMKEFLSIKDKKSNEPSIIPIICINDYVTEIDINIMKRDIIKLKNERLDYTDILKGYEKAISIMKDGAYMNCNENDMIYVHDDTTYGDKSTTSDCGLCSRYNNLEIYRKDIEIFPCPFDNMIDIEKGKKKLRQAIKEYKETGEMYNPWFGCYYRCLLRKGLNINEAYIVLDKALSIVKEEIDVIG